MSTSKRYNRGTNWTKITDYNLSEIINHPFHLGSDGVDYAPYLEELLSEYWRRQEARSLAALKRFEIEQSIIAKQNDPKYKPRKRKAA